VLTRWVRSGVIGWETGEVELTFPGVSRVFRSIEVSVGMAMADAEKASIALREVVASFMLQGRCGEIIGSLIAG